MFDPHTYIVTTIHNKEVTIVADKYHSSDSGELVLYEIVGVPDLGRPTRIIHRFAKGAWVSIKTEYPPTPVSETRLCD
jgi:hypothetical protein